jgi:two-component system sensor histidine kinase HydH
MQSALGGMPFAYAPPMPLTFFESLKQYVGFTDASSAALRELHPAAHPRFAAIVDDFYAAIEAHPEARAAITGGAPQIARLKQTLIRWMDLLLLGPHDQAYYELRARIGRMHVRIALPQGFKFTAMNRIRLRLLDVVRERFADDLEATRRIATALHQILDLELAIMLETYREDLVVKNRNAEKLATIGQFAASMGHELRNPLGVMESSLFLLRKHLGTAAEAPDVAKHLNRIEGEITRANKTIHDLLDLARNRPPRRKRTDVAELVEAAARLASLPATITIDVAPTLSSLAVDVDPDQLQQVLINLFINAAQAMPGGGCVTIEGETAPSGETRLRVRDDGPGIPAEARYRIFEALFTTKAKGSGLGLALCRRILEAHGGTIELEQTSRGASFVLALPPAQPHPAAA